MFFVPLVLFALPAGAWMDRWDRKRTMLFVELVRTGAFASIVAALLTDRLTLIHIVAVSFTEGVGYTFFSIGERSAVRHLVPPPQLPAASAQQQVREYTGLLVGQPLGGFLCSLGRVVPFAVDAVSYLVSAVTLLLIRGDFQEARTAPRRRLRTEVAQGIGFVARQPFLRATLLISTTTYLVVNSLYLVVIVIARDHGESGSTVGLILACFGIGGLAGAVLAPRVAPRLSTRAAILLVSFGTAALVPVLALIRTPLALAGVYGLMFALQPIWEAVVGTARLLVTPDQLQARVSSATTLVSGATTAVGALGTGILHEWIGNVATVLILAAIMGAVALLGLVSEAVRSAPRLGEIEEAAVPVQPTR